MESWRKVWREGVAPLLSVEELNSLHQALITSDKRLIQGNTVQPIGTNNYSNFKCEGCCAITFGYGIGQNHTVEEAENHFADICHRACQALGDMFAVQYFIRWFDETDINIVRKELSSEVQYELQKRNEVVYAGQR